MMDLFAIGNIGAYTKNLKLKTMWDTKKSSGNVTAHQDTGSNWMMEDLERQRESEKLARITTKALNGEKLTNEERDYLRAKSPQAYQQMLNNEREREAFESELRRCETKEEVQRLITDRVNAALSVVKSVENSPYISAEQAVGIAMAELAKVQAYERITAEFIKSGEYGELPTEAEQAQARKDAREAEEAQRKGEAERPAEGAADSSERPEGEDQPVEAASPAKDTEAASQGKRPEHPAGEPEHPAVKAEHSAGEPETAEQRKVRRAKAKAAYVGMQRAPAVPEMPLDVRA